MNANSSITAARFRSRPRKQVLRGLEAALDRQFETRLSDVRVRTKKNLTFEAGPIKDEPENWNG